jgi:hypothetical protein
LSHAGNGTRRVSVRGRRGKLAALSETRLHISPLVYIGGLLVLLVLGGMATLLVMQLSVLRDSREHIVAQDAKITALQKRLEPALSEARPAVREAEPLLREARGLVDPIEEATTSLTAAGDALPVALAAGIDLIEQLSPVVERADGLIRAIRPLVDRAVPLLGDFAPVVRELDSALDRVPHFEELFVTLVQLQRRALRINVRSLRVQQRTMRVLFESIGIQRELLKHARSIDQKLGGTVATGR